MVIALYILGFIAYIAAGFIMGRIVYLQLKTILTKKFFIPFVAIYCLLVYVFPLCGMLSYFTRAGGFLEVMGNIGFGIMGFLLYFIFYGVIVNLIFLLIIYILKKKNIRNEKDKFYVLCLSLVCGIVTTICGYIGQNVAKVTSITAGKGNNELNIVCVSDVHYESFGSTLDLNKMVKRINNQKPDLVFLLGDIIDCDFDKINQNHFIDTINMLESTYGVYVITGNHELKYNTLEEVKEFYDRTNVIFLGDEEVVIDNKVKVIGRIDESYGERKSIKEIDNELIDLPLIVLDHQPQSYKESREYGASFQVSGHTHNAQLYPLNLFVKAFYAINYKTGYINGLYKSNDFTAYITRGYGAWGFQMRTNGNSEIVKVKFKY